MKALISHTQLTRYQVSLALVACAGRGSTDGVENLLAAGARTDDRWHGRTALQAAAEGGHIDVVNRLLTAKAEVNAAAAGDGGRTALQAAAE
jgi:ankyrin repeat protein